MHRLLAPLTAAVVAALVPAAARAADTVVGPAPDVAGLTAAGGQVVFSQRGADLQWRLMRLADGAVQRLAVATQSAPFDADAGTDAAGRPVVTFSQGGRLRVLALTGAGRVRALAGTHVRGAVESRPSMWRGSLAFTRRFDTQAPQLLLDQPGKAERRLSGGSVQTCATDCAAATQTVTALDLGPRRVAFQWRLDGGSIYGVGAAWELRAAGRDGRPSTLLDAGAVSGACGWNYPFGPSAQDARDVTWAQTGGDDDCKQLPTHFLRADVTSGAEQAAPTPGGLVADVARDGDTTYWLRAATLGVAMFGDPVCTSQAAACELVATTTPSFTDTGSAGATPPADVDLLRSGLGYRSVAGPRGVTLLRPPKQLPCAPSAVPASVELSATWARGTHRVTILRDGRRVGFRGPRRVDARTRIACGQRLHVTYVVDGRRRTFTTQRAAR